LIGLRLFPRFKWSGGRVLPFGLWRILTLAGLLRSQVYFQNPLLCGVCAAKRISPTHAFFPWEVTFSCPPPLGILSLLAATRRWKVFTPLFTAFPMDDRLSPHFREVSRFPLIFSGLLFRRFSMSVLWTFDCLSLSFSDEEISHGFSPRIPPGRRASGFVFGEHRFF